MKTSTKKVARYVIRKMIDAKIEIEDASAVSAIIFLAVKRYYERHGKYPLYRSFKMDRWSFNRPVLKNIDSEFLDNERVSENKIKKINVKLRVYVDIILDRLKHQSIDRMLEPHIFSVFGFRKMGAREFRKCERIEICAMLRYFRK